MTWTPREDAALLQATTSHSLHLSPALQQAQWQEVAFHVTQVNGAGFRLADECQERYKALLETARNIEKAQWAGDEKTHELLQAALVREQTSGGLEPTGAGGGTKENESSTTLSTGSDGFTGVTTEHAATGDRPGEDEDGTDASPVLTRGHDEIILCVAAETTSTFSEEWLWKKMAKRAKEESMIAVPTRVWKARYHELLQMTDEAIQPRFEGSEKLCELLNCARTLYERRIRLFGRAFVDTSPCRPLTLAMQTPPSREDDSRVRPPGTFVSSSTVETPTAQAPQQSTANSLEQENIKANESPQLETSGGVQTTSAGPNESRSPTNSAEKRPLTPIAKGSTPASDELPSAPSTGSLTSPTAAVMIAAGGGSSVAVKQVASRKCPREFEGPQVLTREHDEIILRVVAETTSTSSERWEWTKVSRHAAASTMIYIPASVCKARYHELIKMSDGEIDARFAGNQKLCDLLKTAKSDNGRIKLLGKWHPDAVVWTGVSPQSSETLAMQATQLFPQPMNTGGPSVSSSTASLPAALASQLSTPSLLDQEMTTTEANESSATELAAPSNTSGNTQTCPESFQENSALPRPEEEAGVEPEAQQEQHIANEDIAELNEMVALMTSSFSSVCANVTQVTLQNAQLTNDVATVQFQLDETNRALAVAATEMAVVRAQLEQAKDAKTVFQAVEAKCVELVATLRRESIEFEVEQRANIEDILRNLRREIESVREVQQTNHNAINELSTRCQKNTTAERQRHAILFEIIETEMLKREELVAHWKKLQTKYETDKQELAIDVGKLRAKDERNQQAREETMIRFQEAIQLKLVKFQEDAQDDMDKYNRLLLTMQDELKSSLELRVERESGQIEREKMLQEQIHRELGTLKDQLNQKFGQRDELFAAIQQDMESRFQVLDAGLASMKNQDTDTKRHALDQYLQATLELHELRAAVDKERQDRSREFTALLTNIQRLVASESA